MTLQNRVFPDGLIRAHPARGTMTGNRGILHVADGVLGLALWKSKAWICCTLDWKDVRRQVMTGRTWTELFFLDECVALAAGHRPCAYCRRAAFTAYQDAWEQATGQRASAPQMDSALHAARALPGARALRESHGDIAPLPPGAMIELGKITYLLGETLAQPFTSEGYGAPVPRPSGPARILTPAPTLAVLRAGYVPQRHESAANPLFP